MNCIYLNQVFLHNDARFHNRIVKNFFKNKYGRCFYENGLIFIRHISEYGFKNAIKRIIPN